jgi:hypothetical protein
LRRRQNQHASAVNLAWLLENWDAGATIAEIGEEMTKAASLTPTQPMLTADAYALVARIALSLSGLVAAATMAAALYIQIPSLRSAPATTIPAPHDTAQRWSKAIDEPEGEPVRIANPFDKSEVFEFPEGTSEAEARAAMTEMLMERARERYAQLDSQLHKRRGAGS